MKIHQFARLVMGGVIVHDLAGNYMRITKEQKAAARNGHRPSVQKDEKPSQFILDLARDLEANAED